MPQMQGLTEGEFRHLGPRERKFMKVKVAQLCPTLCNPMDYKVHGGLQDRILEWVAFPFFSDPSPGDLPNPGLEPRSPALQADYLPAESKAELLLKAAQLLLMMLHLATSVFST